MWAGLLLSAIVGAPVPSHLEIAENSMTATATLTVTNGQDMSFDEVKACVDTWLAENNDLATTQGVCTNNRAWVEVNSEDYRTGFIDVLVVVQGPYAVDCLFWKTAQTPFPECAKSNVAI